MATFKAIVKSKRKDGFYPVYIRVAHRRKLAYITTDKFVRDSVLSRTGEIEDPYCNIAHEKSSNMLKLSTKWTLSIGLFTML